MRPTFVTARRVIASLASLAIGVRLYESMPHASELREQLFGGATVAVPIAAASLVWIDRIPTQLLARGAWWSMLLIGTLIAISGGHRDGIMGATIAMCSATALLASGGVGLASRGRFAPVAFRGTLLLSLVLAIADTGAISWFSTGLATFDHTYWPIALAIVMAIGVIGLVRLRTWGLIMNVLANVAVMALILTHTLPLPSPLRELFLGSAAVQLVIPLPMLAAVVRGRTPDPDAWRRTKRIAPVVIIVAIAVFAAYGAFACRGHLIDF